MKTIKIGDTITIKAVHDTEFIPCKSCCLFELGIEDCDLCHTIDGCGHFELVEEEK